MNRLHPLARIPLLILVALLVASSAAPESALAKWRPAKAYVDYGYGNNGLSALLVPRKLDVTITNPRTSAAAGPNGSFFAIYSLSSSRTSGERGGMIMKLNAAGWPDPSFGRGGHVRIRGRTGPTRLAIFKDGSMIVLSAATGSQGGTTKWLISKRDRYGRFDRSFGKFGYIHFVIRDPGNSRIPVVSALQNHRFAVVLHDSSKYSPRQVSVFNSRGRLDRRFGGTGRRTFPFYVDSVAPAESGRIIVAGSSNSVEIAKVHATGGYVKRWGKGGVATLRRMPKMAWKPVFTKHARYPLSYVIAEVKAIAIGRAVSFTASSWDSDADGSDEIGWAGRFNSRGRLSRNWGRGGARLLGGSYESSEGDGSSNGATFAPLPDGRLFSANYSSEEWGDFLETSFETVGKSGKKYARGSRSMRLDDFDFYATATSWDGQYMFAYGYGKRGGLVAMRIRI